mmetsp:Transcript_28288/g.74211  ORF Transcript_28288/g.74211 Transcript_28288/m.74211 type:complete len:442 (-) Transcript_28288:48-1373(-)
MTVMRDSRSTVLRPRLHFAAPPPSLGRCALFVCLLLLQSAVVAPFAFTHPGVVVSRELLDDIRARVAAKTEPTYTAFLHITDPVLGRTGPSQVWLANLSYSPNPTLCVPVNASLSPGTRWLPNKVDSLAAYTHALLWYITQDVLHARKAASIMDSWSAVYNTTCDLADSLEAAWSGTIWARAAEVLKHTAPEGVWPEARSNAFATMLQRFYLPMVDEGASTNGNIALVMSEAALHIGIFAENVTAVEAALALWRQQAPAYVYVSSDGVTPKRPPWQRYLARTAPTCGPNCTDTEIFTYWHGNTQFTGHDGVAQETCRDLGHTQMMLSAFANFAETAHHQGIDLYGEEKERIIAGAEFHASLMADIPAPLHQSWPSWLCDGKCRGEYCGPVNGSTFEIIHHHFVTRLNLSLPNVTALLPQIRPTGCFDQLCWETLTHGDPIP